MIHLLQGDPIRGRIVINLLRHAGAIIRQVLVPQRDEQGGQTLVVMVWRVVRVDQSRPCAPYSSRAGCGDSGRQAVDQKPM
jgi:hypothetical protein